MPAQRERYQTFNQTALTALGRLIMNHRQAALATAGDHGPAAAMTAYAPTAGCGSFLVHLSELSPHKGHLRTHPQCGLLIMEPDNGIDEVMRRARLSLTCQARFITRDSDEYEAARQQYLEQLPGHAMMFDLPDFDLVDLTPVGGVFIAGFAQAYKVTEANLAAAAAAVQNSSAAGLSRLV